MNSILANNATDLAISVNTPDNWPFDAVVQKVATRKVGASGLTKSSVTVNRNSLISGVCNEFRSAFPSMFAKRDDKGNIIGEGKDAHAMRLTEEWLDKVIYHVDAFLDARYEEFTKNDCSVSNTRFVHRSSKKDVILRHTLIRDEIIALQEQKLGIMLYMGETKRQLDKINKQASVLSEKTEERRVKLEKRLLKETESFNDILLKIASQKPAEAVIKTVAQ